MTSAAVPLARTPLHDWHAQHGAHFVTVHGWQVPAGYSSAESEAVAARNGVGIADVSSQGKLSYRGKGVPVLAQRLAPDSKRLGVTWLRGEQAALLCRLTDEHLLVLSLTEEPIPPGETGENVLAINVTCALAGFFLIGPRLEELLRRMTAFDVRETSLPVNGCAETSLAGVEALLVRSPEVPLPAMRVYVAWDMAEHVWERLLEAGRDLGIAPLGQEGLRLLMKDH
jgi:sarcosine oxidase subunit alpha